MKYIIILNILFSIIFADIVAKIESTIPLPETKILKKVLLDCNSSCLTDLIIEEQIFSFLAQLPDDIDNFVLKEQRLILESLLNISNSSSLDEIRVALLLPDKIIGRYSESTIKTVFAYLLTKDHKFHIKSYFIDKEDNRSISTALENINRDNFRFVIAPMTSKGAKVIAKLNPDIYLYFPTIHSLEIEERTPYMFFGGINYKVQIEKLVSYIGDRNISLFYDSSKKGKALNSMVLSELNRSKPDNIISIKRTVSKDSSNFSNLFKDNNKTFGNSYFLNTTQVQSSILLAQLTSYDQEPSIVLSTQINYTPILLSMTQPYDRKEMLIANSISNIENRLVVETNSIFNNDIVYDWINYSTTVGIDYIFHMMSGKKRFYKEHFIDNQLIYSIRIMKPLEAKFLELKE